MSDTVDLFTPLELGPLHLPNRLVMAPMTRNRAPDCVANPLMAEYYAQRAGAGLIISEGSQVSPQGVGYPATPGIHSDEQVAGWRQVTDAVHGAGGRIFLQLWHVGRVSHSSMQPDGALPVAPSAIACGVGEAVTYEGMKPFETPRALALEELPGIVADFARGARNARAAGFDGVEIHGANGYLLDQFLRDGSNQRDDAYGGPVENRARLMLEVTEAVCDAWSPDRVGIRLSPLQPFNDMRDSDPEATFSYVVGQLNRFDLGYLHVTEMGSEQPGVAGPPFDLHLLRRLWHGIYITNSGYDKARANAALAAGDADLIAFGVPYIANPDLDVRFARDAPLNVANPDTFYGGGAEGYTDYPRLDDTTTD